MVSTQLETFDWDSITDLSQIPDEIAALIPAIDTEDRVPKEELVNIPFLVVKVEDFMSKTGPMFRVWFLSSKYPGKRKCFTDGGAGMAAVHDGIAEGTTPVPFMAKKGLKASRYELEDGGEGETFYYNS